MKQVAEEPESWEELEALKLGGEEGEKGEGEGNNNEEEEQACVVGEGSSTEQKISEEESEGDKIEKVDKAIQEALQNTRERQTVLRIDGEVEKFVRDPSRTVLEFGQDLTSYQRLLAHRVSQHYSLQTTSVPWGKGLSRVVARRTPETKMPEVRVTDLMEVYKPPESANPKVMPEITIKRRQGAAVGRALPNSAGGRLQAGQGVMTVKQREEEYKAARDRILGNQSDVQADAQNTSENTGGAGRSSNAEDARNRKAVFKNKQVEMQDPDYKRGTNRYARSMFDPTFAYYEQQQRSGIYNVPTYSSEFPALPGGHQAPPAGTAPPQYFQQNMGGWGMAPGPHQPAKRPQQNYQALGPSSSMPAPTAPYSMPTYPMSHMGYGYPPENMQQQAYHQPVTTSAMPYRGMAAPWNAQRMGNYGSHTPPAQDSMGMVHPMHGMAQMYGYPPQGPGYGMEYNDMSRMQYPMSAANGYGGSTNQYRNTDTGSIGQPKPGENLVPKHENSTKPQPVEN